MIVRPKFTALVLSIAALSLVLFVCGCDRSALRIPGASLPFPDSPTGYAAKATYPHALVVSNPVDQRAQHYGERVAGTKWTGGANDALWSMDATQIVQQRLLREFRTSGLFSKVSTVSTSPDDIVVKTEIHAFCSQAVGFLIARVAGITSLRVTMEQHGRILLDRKFEKVVTDADKEYTGSQVTFIEQAMRVTMADSLRELVRDVLEQTEAEANSWQRPM